MKKNTLVKRLLSSTLVTYYIVFVAYLAVQFSISQGSLSYSLRGQLVPICTYIVLAVSLNLLVGICGELSLGHAGFMGIGAFTGVVVAALCQNTVPNELLRLVLSICAGGFMAAVIGFIVGIPVLRLRGDYLAIVTLAFGEIIKSFLNNAYVGVTDSGARFSIATTKPEWAESAQMIVKGNLGASVAQRLSTFEVGFVLILVTLFVVLNLVNSKEGRAIKAVRDNRIAAESVGINVTAFRMKAFVLSAMLAGMAGALYGLNFRSVTASKFDFNTSINILVFVVLGGMGNILGSVIAATVLYILPEMMRELEDYRMILYAVVLIVVMLFTWSPKVKEINSVIVGKIKGVFCRKGGGEA